MPTQILVFSNPVEGREEDYNDWYTNVHLSDVLTAEGIIAAQRFELSSAQSHPDQKYKYLAIYEVDDAVGAEAAVHNMLAGARTFTMSDAIDFPGAMVSVYEPITDVVR